MLTEDPEGQKMAETLIEVGIMGTKFILSKYIPGFAYRLDFFEGRYGGAVHDAH